MTDHTLAAEHLHFAWDDSLPPVLRITSGDCVTFETWDASRHEIQRTSTSAYAARSVTRCDVPGRVGNAYPLGCGGISQRAQHSGHCALEPGMQGALVQIGRL